MLTCTGPSDISALLITEMRVTTGRALMTMADSVGGWESVVPRIAERGPQVCVSTTGKASLVRFGEGRHPPLPGICMLPATPSSARRL